MQLQHAELLARLESFSPDEPGSSFTFTQRLAKENGWSMSYARRVVAEYKRFAFLAVTAGHPVSPSDAVDQVWHLHLVFTRSYWKTFCGEVLRQPLHHEPSRGGSKEIQKFSQWYEQTLTSYEKLFGERPPQDIWPAASIHNSTHHAFQRVDRARRWLVPKPRRVVIASVLATGMLKIAAGCSSRLVATIPLFDLKGPQFLAAYVTITAAAFGIALFVRHRLRLPIEKPRAADLPKDPYVIAALAGGPGQIVNAALVSLEQQGTITIDGNNPVKIKPVAELPSNAHPVEKHIRNHLASDGDSIITVRERFRSIADQIYDVLATQRFVMNDADRKRTKIIPFAIVFAAALIGVVKIMIGIARDKPVGYLVALVILTVIAALVTFWRAPRRSLLGERVLTQVRDRYRQPDRMQAPTTMDAIMPAVALGVAIYGLSQLDGTAHSHLRKQLTPAAVNSGTSCGSSCGGESSGGSSCGGGGGCGGGGCGGCGGGGD